MVAGRIIARRKRFESVPARILSIFGRVKSTLECGMNWDELVGGGGSAPPKKVMKGRVKGFVLTDTHIVAVKNSARVNKSACGKFSLDDVHRVEKATRPKGQKNGRPVFFNLFKLFGGGK